MAHTSTLTEKISLGNIPVLEDQRNWYKVCY